MSDFIEQIQCDNFPNPSPPALRTIRTPWLRQRVQIDHRANVFL